MSRFNQYKNIWLSKWSEKSFNCNYQDTITWSERAKVCGELMLPIFEKHSSRITVADIGCGDQKLKLVLQEQNYSIDYNGFDLLPQSVDVKYLDITKQSLPDHFDIAIMLGVSEYLNNLSDVVLKLSDSADYFVVSHVVRRDDLYTKDSLDNLGWVNHLTELEFESLLENSGFIKLRSEVTPDKRTIVLLCKSKKIIRSNGEPISV